METVDEFVVRTLPALTPTGRSVAAGVPTLQRLFAAQVQSRHLDLAARWLQSRGRGYYTIGSAGHEANAALGLMSRIDDPALLHYRSGALYAARAALAGTTDPVRDILLSLTSARSDPMSGGRHKVFGHPALHIVPQTSTIASHLPRAVGLAYALRLAARLDHRCPWPTDAVVICSFGDASANHSTAVGAFNAAAYLTHRGIACPVLFVCEDNRIGISTPSPPDWPAAPLRSLPGVPYTVTSGDDPDALLATTAAALDRVRTTRRPGVLHLRTVRFMGHAGSDAEIGYRTRGQILADYDRDPLVATAQALVDAGAWSGQTALDHYEATRRTVMAEASRVLDESPLTSRESVIEPIRLTDLGPPNRHPAVAIAPGSGPTGSPRIGVR